ncbi:unnamed protein product [Toxocara canis]|uniref:CENP-V/GFA domain-containing protein n=1 Tax=Toxocara canis TaxID=6265 RepID=A0A183VGZ2_TOXCA|nr:unnamed protein product [Toxocara canis]
MGTREISLCPDASACDLSSGDFELVSMTENRERRSDIPGFRWIFCNTCGKTATAGATLYRWRLGTVDLQQHPTGDEGSLQEGLSIHLVHLGALSV